MGHGGAGCGKVVDKRFDVNIACGVGRGHFALANMTWPELLGMTLWTEDSMGILVMCGHRAISVDENIGFGISMEHFALDNGTWQSWL